MAMSEIVLKGGVSEDGLKVVVKDGYERFLFAVVTDGEGKVTIQDAEGNNIGDGGYIKPNTGIPDTDLSEEVQTSLGKADSALQPGTLPSEASEAGSIWAFTYDPTGQTYSWQKVKLPTE